MTPVLLLIPGLLNTPAVFDRVRALLGPGAEVRVLDVTAQSGIEQMAADGWSLVADLPPTTPLCIAGFSMGGYVALAMAAEPRRALQGLALICSSARADAGDGQALRERAIAAIERDFGRYVASLCLFLTTAATQADAALMQAIRDDMLAAGADAAVRQHRAAAGRVERRPLLPSLTMPLLVVAGGDDKVTPAALSAEIAAAAPAARLATLPGVGHLVPWERPAELARLLGAWLEDCSNQGDE